MPGCTNFVGHRAKFPIDSALRAASQIAHGSVEKTQVMT